VQTRERDLLLWRAHHPRRIAWCVGVPTTTCSANRSVGRPDCRSRQLWYQLYCGADFRGKNGCWAANYSNGCKVRRPHVTREQYCSSLLWFRRCCSANTRGTSGLLGKQQKGSVHGTAWIKSAVAIACCGGMTALRAQGTVFHWGNGGTDAAWSENVVPRAFKMHRLLAASLRMPQWYVRTEN
jgi:hypothetical protein